LANSTIHQLTDELFVAGDAPTPTSGIGASSRCYCEQLDAIMRTVSTFSFGALLAVDPAAPAVVDVADPVVVAPVDALSRVPVISTLCPTCAVSFASSASRRYVLPLVAAAAVEPAPAVPVGLVAVDPLVLAGGCAPDDPDICALVRMKLESVELPVVPLVPVAPAVPLDDPRWMHPVTVT
jgi:hypothetical protein